MTGTSTSETNGTGTTGTVRLTASQVDRVLGVAQAAPSLDNSQPWSIQLVGDEFEVCTDARLAAPVADPDGRQRVISTGAALFNLRLALRVLGWAADTKLFPDPERPGLVARVVPRPGPPPTPEEWRMSAALVWRRTWRGPFSTAHVPPRILAHLAVMAQDEGAVPVPIEDPADRDRLAPLLVAAVREQLTDPNRAEEQLRWLRLWPADDGIPLANLATAHYPIPGLTMPEPLGGLERWPAAVRGLAYRDALLLLATPADRPPDWARVGGALQRVLLAATRYGLATGFLNQPIECAPLRERLTEMLVPAAHPQLLLRLGYPAGPRPPATPRRVVSRDGR